MSAKIRAPGVGAFWHPADKRGVPAGCDRGAPVEQEPVDDLLGVAAHSRILELLRVSLEGTESDKKVNDGVAGVSYNTHNDGFLCQ
jgi:hypothetical protein